MNQNNFFPWMWSGEGTVQWNNVLLAQLLGAQQNLHEPQSFV